MKELGTQIVAWEHADVARLAGKVSIAQKGAIQAGQYRTFLQPALRPAAYFSSYRRPSAPPMKMRPVLQKRIPRFATQIANRNATVSFPCKDGIDSRHITH